MFIRSYNNFIIIIMYILINTSFYTMKAFSFQKILYKHSYPKIVLYYPMVTSKFSFENSNQELSINSIISINESFSKSNISNSNESIKTIIESALFDIKKYLNVKIKLKLNSLYKNINTQMINKSITLAVGYGIGDIIAQLIKHQVIIHI